MQVALDSATAGVWDHRFRGAGCSRKAFHRSCLLEANAAKSIECSFVKAGQARAVLRVARARSSIDLGQYRSDRGERLLSKVHAIIESLRRFEFFFQDLGNSGEVVLGEGFLEINQSDRQPKIGNAHSPGHTVRDSPDVISAIIFGYLNRFLTAQET